MASRADTRSCLISTAERLFALRGIDNVSLREITRESGARNAVAAQYHFKDRAGIVDAILAKHQTAVESARHSLLDQFEATANQSGMSDAGRTRLLVSALVRPLAAKLSDHDGGPQFLEIYKQVLDRPDDSTVPVLDSLMRWRAMLDPYLEPDAVRLHRRYTAILYTVTELARRARGAPHKDDRLFTSYLIDVVTGILTFPVSEETRGWADERLAHNGAGLVRGRMLTQVKKTKAEPSSD